MQPLDIDSVYLIDAFPAKGSEHLVIQIGNVRDNAARLLPGARMFIEIALGELLHCRLLASVFQVFAWILAHGYTLQPLLSFCARLFTGDPVMSTEGGAPLPPVECALVEQISALALWCDLATEAA